MGHTQDPGRARLTCPGSGRNPPSPNTRTPSQVRTEPPRTRASGSAPVTRETAVREMPPSQQPASTHGDGGFGEAGSLEREAGAPAPLRAFRAHPCSSAAAQKRAQAAGRRRGECPRGRSQHAGRPRDTRLSLSLHFTLYYQPHRGRREFSVIGLIYSLKA